MKKEGFRLPSRISRTVLRIELALSVLHALVFLISYLQMRECNLGYALYRYPPLVAYLLYPLLITAFSVLLIERLTLEAK